LRAKRRKSAKKEKDKTKSKFLLGYDLYLIPKMKMLLKIVEKYPDEKIL
jgi:hypothetical protein